MDTQTDASKPTPDYHSILFVFVGAFFYLSYQHYPYIVHVLI